MEAAIQRVLRFLRWYVCNKLRRMSRRVSFDSPRLQLNGLLTQETVLRDKVRAALIPCDRLVGI